MVASSRVTAEPEQTAFATDLKYLARQQRAKTIWHWYCRVSIACLLALTIYHVL